MAKRGAKRADEKFHQRNRGLIFLAALGGVYLPSMKRIIPYKWFQVVLKGYGGAIVTSLMFCTLMAGRHMIFLADNLILRIMAANNVFNDFVCCGRAFLFNRNRDKAQAVFDKWDEYFTGDGHDEERKNLLTEITRPNRKYIFASAAFIQFMLVSWSSEQLGHDNCEFSVPIGLPFNNRNPEYLIWATMIFITFSLFGPMLLSVDALIMEPLTLIAAEFSRLRHSLADIFNTTQVTEGGELQHVTKIRTKPFESQSEIDEVNAEVDYKLKKWIVEHQKLLDFHMSAMEVIHWPLAIQLFCTTMTVCLISFIIATKLLSAFDTFIALLFFVPNYVLFFITSTYGNLVEENAADLLKSAFATSWSVYPLRIQKNLHIIAMKTNYTVGLNIGHMYPLGCKTYFQILQTAYSFYSFLRVLTGK